MKVTQYNLITADGFITDINGTEDIFPDELFDEYLRLCEEFGVTIMGSGTYKKLTSWNISDNRFLNAKKIVVSGSNIELPENYIFSQSPKEALSIAEKMGFQKVLLCSGQKLNTSFLSENLIDEFLFYIYPAILGNGSSIYEKEHVCNMSLKTIDSTNPKLTKFHYLKSVN